MNADTLTWDVEGNDSFQRQFSPSCNFPCVVWKFDDSGCSFALSLSLTCTVVIRRRFRRNFAVVDGRRFRPTSGHLEFLYVYYVGTATIRTIGRRVEYVDNHQNNRSKSGICCRVQTSFLRVVGCRCISVHVPTSFCCCEIQPVVLGDEKCQSDFFL